jgi:FeS assembly protein IscX
MSEIAIMKWTDSLNIAESLYDKHPDIDPRTIRFTDLMDWVMALDGFNDAPEKCGERILEAIQLAWIDETE